MTVYPSRLANLVARCLQQERERSVRAGIEVVTLSESLEFLCDTLREMMMEKFKQLGLFDSDEEIDEALLDLEHVTGADERNALPKNLKLLWQHEHLLHELESAEDLSDVSNTLECYESFVKQNAPLFPSELDYWVAKALQDGYDLPPETFSFRVRDRGDVRTVNLHEYETWLKRQTPQDRLREQPTDRREIRPS